MSVMLLRLAGAPVAAPTLAVRLDDRSPGYAATFAAIVARHVDPAVTVLWAEVDVLSVAEYGPDSLAALLRGDPEAGMLDIPQGWQEASR